jgi:hypothetical protein
MTSRLTVFHSEWRREQRPMRTHGMSPVQVQVQVCFTSVDGQVQPLDVALGHTCSAKVVSNSSAKCGNISLGVLCGLTHQRPASVANGAYDWWY